MVKPTKILIIAFLFLFLFFNVSFAFASSNDKKSVIVFLNDNENPFVYSLGLRDKGISVPYVFHIFNGFVAEVDDATYLQLQGDKKTKKVYSDFKVNLIEPINESSENPVSALDTETMNESTIQIQAQELWAKDIKGQGIEVAVLDTGIDDSHPALENKIHEEVDFTWWDSKLDANDDYGHGTHVAGIIAGNWEEGNFSGVAPEAKLLNVKVLDGYGSGYLSSIVKGIEWSIDHNVDVISLSLGGFGYSDDLLSYAVDKAVDSGIVVVVAAGNSGPEEFRIGSPATSRKAISVGAVDKNGSIADFSSRGPLDTGEVKPDVVAPGVQVLSACIMGGQFSGCDYANNSYFIDLSGTSMATPQVSGVVALLLSENPGLTPEQIKSILKTGAVRNTLNGDARVEGAGLVNALNSYNLMSNISISPNFLFFGIVDNGSADVPVPLTFFNFGNSAKTVNLSVSSDNYSFSPANSQFTIPSEGKITMTLSLKKEEILKRLSSPGFYGDYLSLNINNGEKIINAYFSFVIPEKLNISEFNGVSASYAETNNIASEETFSKWYEIELPKDSNHFEIKVLDTNLSNWNTYPTIAVINPENKVVGKDLVFETYYSYYDSPMEGKWIFALASPNADEKSLSFNLSRPAFNLASPFLSGTPGDNLNASLEIKNLLDVPIKFSFNDNSSYSYNPSVKLDELNRSIDNQESILYFETNIENNSDGFLLKFLDNANSCLGYEFRSYVFDPTGKEYETPNPYVTVSSDDYYYNQQESLRIDSNIEGTWTVILIPNYYWFYTSTETCSYNGNYFANITLESYKLNKQVNSSWSKPSVNDFVLDAFENSDWNFNVAVPSNALDLAEKYSWHQDSFTSTVSMVNSPSQNGTASFVIPISIENYLLNFNILNKVSSINSKNISYYVVKPQENLSYRLKLYGYDNSAKQGNVTMDMIHLFDVRTWVYEDSDGNEHTKLDYVADDDSWTTIATNAVNGTGDFSYTLPSEIEGGYWAIFYEGYISGETLTLLYIDSGYVNVKGISGASIDARQTADVNLELKFNTEANDLLKIQKYSSNPLGTNLDNAVKYIEISPDVGLLPKIDSATLKINYLDSDISGLQECTLKIYHYNATNNSWEVVPSNVDMTSNFVEANLTSFSIYALSGSPVTTPSPYCGDHVCSSSNGETCSNCPGDCGVCSTPPTTPQNTNTNPGGGSGGGSSSRGNDAVITTVGDSGVNALSSSTISSSTTDLLNPSSSRITGGTVGNKSGSSLSFVIFFVAMALICAGIVYFVLNRRSRILRLKRKPKI